MENGYVYLTYYQTMIFLHRLEEMKKANQYFSDAIAEEFENYTIARAKEILFTHPQIKLKLVPKANKYVISESMFNYLSRLTEVNPLDKEVMKAYKPILKQAEADAQKRIFGIDSSEEQHKHIK